jgi:hypothetical protein
MQTWLNLLFDVDENTGQGGKPRGFVIFVKSVIVIPPTDVGGKSRPATPIVGRGA